MPRVHGKPVIDLFRGNSKWFRLNVNSRKTSPADPWPNGPHAFSTDGWVWHKAPDERGRKNSIARFKRSAGKLTKKRQKTLLICQDKPQTAAATATLS